MRARMRGRQVGTSPPLSSSVLRSPAPASQNRPARRRAKRLRSAADQVLVAERPAGLARGLDRAEQAVRADPRDAVAHFAVFCNLGKRLEMKRRGGAWF